MGTGSSGTSNGSGSLQQEPAQSFKPGMHVVCLENYASEEPGALQLAQGDIVEVTGLVDDGVRLEGALRGVTGVFPASCVQEVRLRNPEGVMKGQQQQQQQPTAVVSPVQQQQQRVQGRREIMQQQQMEVHGSQTR